MGFDSGFEVSPNAALEPGSIRSEFEGWYRVIVAIGVACLFWGQKLVEFRLHGPARVYGGYAVSLAFVFGTVELATVVCLRLGLRLRRRLGQDRMRALRTVVVATLLLLANIRSDLLSGYIQAVPHSSVTRTAVVVGLLWLLLAVHSVYRGGRGPSLLLGLTALVVMTRLQAYANTPWTDLSGDMFPTLKRGLDSLFAGEYPYRNYPPPMPYFPLTFLAYAPAKLFGLDLRISNLVLEIATIATMASVFDGRRWFFSATATHRAAADGYLLPLFLLLPTSTFYSANAPIAPTVLAAALVGRSLFSGTARQQSIALGAAVATNPTLGALGFAIGGSWLQQHGGRRTIVLAALAAAMCLAVLAPFLLWDARQFVSASFLDLAPFTDAQFAGRFSLNPLIASAVSAHAVPVVLLVCLSISSWLGFRAKRPAGVAGAGGLGLSLALMLLYRTFSHYFLPVMALAAMSEPGANREGGHGA